ncbi:ureidoglycolate lyase [Pseudothauera nasutitermitis]|uniref:Ureidoglycolate lyase n=1 Tax=Pseudothauera nasutitermitis TaxID=2565930 RepID=A0A4S4B1U6_9RHOO|nr:ureidoglycolate lyase [Pseudothauera nasutitermitis]THF66532.1 ureidoglycolate lyase [Pseudothauera nasutitermitis]
MKPLRATALDAAAFAPFGEVIEAGAATRQFPINQGSTVRYHDLARIDPGEDGHAIVSIFRAQPRALPFEVSMLERHPRGSQAFMPLSGRPYLVVVAPPGERPATENLRVFLARADQGVNYAAGVWHHPLLALQAESDFLVIDRAGPGANCDEITLDEAVYIDLG